MPVAIYVDDSFDWDFLILLLRNAGHTVISPRAVGTSRADDDVHLAFAAQNGYVVLTRDADDFDELHKQWQSQGRSHTGILLVYYEGDITKDMKPRDIVRAIGNLIASGVPITNEVHVLNHWR
jgi:hypothetical protein